MFRASAPSLIRTAPLLLKTRLYVGNLDYAVTEGELLNIFSKFGKVKSINKQIRPGRAPTQSQPRTRRFGFVEFDTEQDASKAIMMLDGQPFEGRPLVVRHMTEK
eukprot:EG_transcript_46762